MKIPFSTAFVTGSSRGIGRGIAVKLASEGVHKIGVHYRTRRDEAEKTAALVKDAGAEAVLVQGDVADASPRRGRWSTKRRRSSAVATSLSRA